METIVSVNWDTCARMLGQSLARYNGLTNDAKLEFITELVVGNGENDPFSQKPFLSAYEVIEQFSERVGGMRSAQVLMQHAIAFGFLHRATSGSTRRHRGTIRHKGLKTRIETTAHIALTPLGKALRSAQVLTTPKQKEFVRFVWEYALLTCDFDLYALLIKMAEENHGEMVSLNDFYNRYYAIRDKKYNMLRSKFPFVEQREQIKKHLKWFKRRGLNPQWKWEDGPPKFEGETPKHHYRQRKQWAQKHGHIDNAKTCLTKVGMDLARKLPATEGEPFFWLGPPREFATSRFLKPAEINASQCAPAWNLLRSKGDDANDSVSDRFVSKLAEHIENSYSFIRMANFNQAPLEAIQPYVYFLEKELNERVGDLHELFRTVFTEYRDTFVCTVRPNLSQSHFWLRNKERS